MREFTIKEYTEEEYKADMQKLLEEKGLYKAVEDKCDRINSLSSTLRYLPHREIQELMCDILFLIDLQGENTTLEDIKAERYNQGFYDGYKKATEQANAVVQDIKAEINECIKACEELKSGKYPMIESEESLTNRILSYEQCISFIDSHIDRKEQTDGSNNN